MEIKRETLDADDPEIAYYEACYLALAGNRDAAIGSLNRAVELGLVDPGLLAQSRELASLRGDPEFEAIVADMKKRREAGDTDGPRPRTRPE